MFYDYDVEEIAYAINNAIEQFLDCDIELSDAERKVIIKAYNIIDNFRVDY